jgi:uncharacterized glyoxalase superfamily protein PhnB
MPDPAEPVDGSAITTTERVNPPDGYPRVLPHLIYEDVRAAVEMLTDLFGFQERTFARHTSTDGTVGRTQMQVIDTVITLGQPSIHGDSPRNGVSSMLYVYVDDVDEHYQHAKTAGADIVSELEKKPWGDRCYQARDSEGHQWTFAQHVGPADVGHYHQ